MNNPPFSIGQKVVALATVKSLFGVVGIMKGQDYVIKDLCQAPCCKHWIVDVGIVPPTPKHTCSKCGKERINSASTWFFCASRFAPIITNYYDATAEILEKFKSPAETPDKILTPEKIEQ